MIWIEFRFDSVSLDSRRLGVTPPQITNQGRFQNQGKVRGGGCAMMIHKIKYPPPALFPQDAPEINLQIWVYTLYKDMLAAGCKSAIKMMN